MQKYQICNQFGNMQAGDMILNYLHISWQHIIRMEYVTNLVTWLPHFNYVSHKWSNYAQNRVYFNERGLFHL